VVGDSITTSAEGISFETQLRPVYYEGSHHIATFAVAVQEGRIIGVGTPSFKQEEFIGVFADAEIVSGQGATYSVEVPWEKRAEGKVFAKAKNAAYTEKSFIEIPANTSQNLLTAIQQLPFVTAVQPGVVSVKNSFVDSGIVTIQFMSVNITPTFPPSIARFSDATNQSALSLIADLEAANISSKLKTDRIVGARLPEYVEANGEKYNTAGMIVYFDGTSLPQNATTVNLTFGFAADGNLVTAIISPRPA
jgi:hypothetical protein